MIDPDKRKAMYLLHTEGMGIREIARRLGISPNTVIAIIAQKGVVPKSDREDKVRIDPELLIRVHHECEGRIERVHEKLTEEHGIEIGYSTLTRMIREMDLGKSQNKRCAKVPDQPGVEMQHDTSDYRVRIAEKMVRVIGSLLYFRYSKVRYLKFYRSFNRFKMKCFFHEALSFWGYGATVCIIDNTNLARLRGTGKNAIIVPEMEAFAKQYGFEFVCHEKGHANRKAGNERGFFTVETNFFPGRKFESLEDMNRQAFDWATQRMANRATGKTGLIPAKAFESEKSYLTKLPLVLTPPYLFHKRGTDQYGYVLFDGNFYWLPGQSRYDVSVLQYADRIDIYHRRELLAAFDLPPDGVRNQVFVPKGYPNPPQQPKYRKKPAPEEEKKLRALDDEVDGYLAFLKTQKGVQWHQSIRALYGLYQKTTLPLFVKTIKRALKYHITDMKTVERIALLQINAAHYQLPLVEIDVNLHDRDTYREGCFSDEVDLSMYDQMMEEEDG
jgi:transposase